MLVTCNSCQKKFNVPDSAITESGRLLQCGSCGNKWTQYPIKEKIVKEIKKINQIKIKQTTKEKKIKTTVKKKKREINLYSEEYLKKKHGLEIKDSLTNAKIKNNKKINSNNNFFNYLIILIIFAVGLFGILNLTKDFIILAYPSTTTFINSLYEFFEILRLIIINFKKLIL